MLLNECLPYILKHKNSVFVVVITENLLAKKTSLQKIVEQICMLSNLGIKIVLIAGIYPPQKSISRQLAQKIAQKNANIRCYLEELFTISSPNPIGSKYITKIISGNLATAKPMGIIDGINHEMYGKVKYIDSTSINEILAMNSVTLITPSLHSVVGGVPILVDYYDLANSCVNALSADKLIILHADKNLTKNSALTPNDLADSAINQQPLIVKANQAIINSVPKVHLIYALQKNSLLTEIFSREGSGILLSQQPFEEITAATKQDLGGLLHLIKPLEKQGALTTRQVSMLEQDIEKYYFVMKRDIYIIASGALIPYKAEKMAEIACIAVNAKDIKNKRGSKMLAYLEEQAKLKGAQKTFCLTTQAEHWFIERGYKLSNVSNLPKTKQQQIDASRNSKILIKSL